MRASSILRTTIAFALLPGVAPYVESSPLSYSAWLSNDTAVTGAFNYPLYDNIADSIFYRITVPATNYGGSYGVGLMYDLTGPAPAVDQLRGDYRLFAGVFSDTVDLPPPMSVILFNGHYGGNYSWLPAGDYTVVLNSTWTAYYDPPSGFGYAFKMFNIADAPSIPISEPPMLLLLLSGLMGLLATTTWGFRAAPLSAFRH